MTCISNHRGDVELQLLPIRTPAPKGAGCSAPSYGRFTPMKGPVAIRQDLSGRQENPHLTGIRFQDPPARS